MQILQCKDQGVGISIPHSQLIFSWACCIICICTSNGIVYSNDQSISLRVSASSTLISRGDTVDFSVVAEGGRPPYRFCWDFGTPPKDAVLGSWDHDNLALCYSSEQNPSHTYHYVGIFETLLTVSDSVGEKTRSMVFIEVSGGATAFDAVNDLGLDNTGIDNGQKLSAYLNALPGTNKKIKVLFPAGTYRFSEKNTFDEKYEFIWLEAAQGQDVIFLSDPTEKSDGNSDLLFHGVNHPGNNVIRNITFRYNLPARTEPMDWDPSSIYATRNKLYTIYQQVTIQDFTTCFADSHGSIYRSNLLDWQGYLVKSTSNRKSKSAVYGHHNMMLRDNYFKSRHVDHEHLVYSSGDGDPVTNPRRYIYYVGNWGDQANCIERAVGYRHQGSGDQPVRYRYCFRNLVKNLINYPFYIGGGDSPGNRARDIQVIDNVVDSCGWVYLLDSEPNSNIEFKYNHLQNNAGFRVGSGSYANIDDVDFVGNVFGYNTPIRWNYWWFGADDCADCDYTDVNPQCVPLGEVHDNVDNDTYVDTSDPGPWEYTPPTVHRFEINEGPTSSLAVTLSLDVSDQGSGMADFPRWPYLQGGLMQFSNNGVEWSEVRQYANMTIWTLTDDGQNPKLVYARFRDCDGNWCESVSDIYMPGDMNNDDAVNFQEFSNIASSWGRSNCNTLNSWCDKADLDGDGKVGFTDLRELARYWLMN